ncbi:MAG: gamma-glutamyltransferase, partial [Acidimicrobiales bacterium]
MKLLHLRHPHSRLFRFATALLAALVFLAFGTDGLVLAQTRPTRPADAGIVVSDHGLASQAGNEVLRRGGNAIDAAVATA